MQRDPCSKGKLISCLLPLMYFCTVCEVECTYLQCVLLGCGYCGKIGTDAKKGYNALYKAMDLISKNLILRGMVQQSCKPYRNYLYLRR